jgi:hypothetical protein
VPTKRQPWPRVAEAHRLDAIAQIDSAVNAIINGDPVLAIKHAKAAKEALVRAGYLSADADPLEDPTLREYITSVVEEKVKQILKQREESQHHGTEES